MMRPGRTKNCDTGCLVRWETEDISEVKIKGHQTALLLKTGFKDDVTARTT